MTRVPVGSPGGAPASCCSGSGAYNPTGGAAAPPSSAAASSSVLVTAGGATYSLDLAYWLGIRASVAAKQPVTLKTVVQVIRSLDGRDKVTKVRPSVRGLIG